jgi:hypothetical protein
LKCATNERKKERKKNIKGNTRNYNILDAEEVIFVFALCLRRGLVHPHFT